MEIVMIDDELKPCPFCGREAMLLKVEDYGCYSRLQVYFGIGCNTPDCRCEKDPDECYHKTKDEAIEQWNRRDNVLRKETT